jgi:hypothetical protein
MYFRSRFDYLCDHSFNTDPKVEISTYQFHSYVFQTYA